jgi:uncharacterized protein
MATARSEFPALAALAGSPPEGAPRDGTIRPQGPPPSLAELRERRAEVMMRLEPYGVRDLVIFGSVARGSAGPGSDLDVLVDLDPARRGLLDLAGVGAALEDLLGCRVDVVAPRFLSVPLPERVLHGAVAL